MNPTPNRQAVIVGLFIALAVLILAGGVLTVGDLNDTFTRKFTVSVVFEEVNGLQRGDNVWYSGLKIGTVQGLSFRDGSQVEVVMKIDRSAAPFVHNDALVKIGSDGLIGNRIVVLYDDTAGAPTIAEGDILTAGKAVSTEEMMTMLQANNANLLAITTDLKGITGGIAAGEGTVGKLLKDEALYARATDTVQTLGEASTNARTLTASLSTFSANLNRAGSLPNDLVTDHTTYPALTRTVASLEQTGAHADALVEGLARGANDPNSPLGTLMHDRAAGTDVRATLDNLNRGSQLLAEDLEAVQHNFLLRGFFKKKAKAAAKAPPPPEEDQAPTDDAATGG